MSSVIREDSYMADEALPDPPAIPEEAQEAGKLQFRKALGFLVFGVLFLAGFAAFLQFCMACSGSDSTKFVNGTSIFLPGKSCSDLREVVPLKWSFAVLPREVFMCSWRPGVTALRVFCSLFGLGCAGVLFCTIFPKTKGKFSKFSFVGVLAFCALTVLLMFIATIVDGTASSHARSYCSQRFPSAPFLPSLIFEDTQTFEPKCYTGYAAGVVFADVFAFLTLGSAAAFIVFYKRQEKEIGQIIPDTNRSSEETPIISSAPVTASTTTPAKKDVYAAEEIKDESLTQDVTGDNPFAPKN